MKKIAMITIGLAMIGVACSSPTKEFGVIYDNATKEINALTESIKGAKDAKEAAAVIDKFVALIKDSKEKSSVLTKKYGFKEGEIPASLKEKSDALVEASKKFGEEGMGEAMKKFGAAPEIREALKKLQNLKD